MKEEIVGLIPAAGLAQRLSPLPGSKELFPVGFRQICLNGFKQLRPKVVSQYVLDSMFRAGAKKVWMVLGAHKFDIMQYYGDGSAFGGHIAYLFMEKLWGMPYTLDQAWPWVCENTVLFGMPDTIFSPEDTFSGLLESNRGAAADVTLGIFPTDHPEKLCPVVFDEDGRVMDMFDKPVNTEFMNTWGCAVWRPSFSDFMHRYLMQIESTEREVVLADVFRAALHNGLAMNGVFFQNGEYIDIGTPDDLVTAVRRFSI